jgi:hypothetical protein
MSNRKKKTPIPGSAKGTLSLDAKASPEKVVTIVTAQLANAQACPDYPNQPTVQTAATTLKGSLGSLSGILANLANARALVITLESQRDAECVVVRRDQASLGSAINSVSQGVPKALAAWGAATQTRTILATSTDPPLGVKGKALGNGLVLGECTRDKAAKCYLFQIGTDPTNLAGWPPPVVSNGCRHTFSGPVGQKLYFRVAVQRTRVGLGQWSDIVEVTVR